ncbi:MAG TPA: prenyltransferase [Myxococcota bacterium]|nr:prenyltransferase [Myxococcota bacterium]HRY93028.1 prenyltransferase [Myxococcota bacterium]HSA22194.1 prenyltransferase [Myxococcota bacterium]
MTLPRSAARRWLVAMRLPFTTVALAPYLAGAWLARAHGALVSPLAAALGLAAVLLICVGCYLSGEIFDQREDLLTLRHGRSRFAGGTLLVAQGLLPARAVAAAAVACFASALGLGLAVVLVLGAWWLLLLGAFGGLTAALYSTPPVRLVARGVGEPFIGVCYGWLTLATGYGCASGALLPHSLWLSLAPAFTVVAIILINEFPDFEADRGAGKRNLLQRVGRPAGAWIYAGLQLGAAAALAGLWAWARPGRWGYAALVVPAVLLSLGLAVQVGLRGRWRAPAALERVCALTVVSNLVASLEVAVLARWS